MTYLEITLTMDKSRRVEAAAVYDRYKKPFLNGIPGAVSKELLVRDEDVQVLHGFSSAEHGLSAAYPTVRRPTRRGRP
ncbi:hypothetical protein [Streptomyces sp. NPDC059010]|uniref:hypothetical protein n=1 Tax=Streptomyces sp. NPDC059010 TaxID=3346695 RepID=UPI0036C73A09